jgi:hypothetical protein
MCDMYKGQASYRRLTPSDYSEKIVNNELEKLPHEVLLGARNKKGFPRIQA